MKTIKILFVLMVAAVYVSAQTPYIGAKAQYGITRLPNSQLSLPISYKEGSYAANKDVKLDISFGRSYGLYGGFQLLRIFKLQGELLFTEIVQNYKDLKKNVTIAGANTTIDYKAITNVKNVDLPVMAVVGNIMYLEAGPVFNVLLKSSFSSDIDSVMNSDGSMIKNVENADIDIKNRYSKINVGLGVGTGTSISISHFGFHAGVRYYMGLNKFGKNLTELQQNVKTERTGVWSLMLNIGMRFIF